MEQQARQAEQGLKLRELTGAEIDHLASLPGVRRIAVENRLYMLGAVNTSDNPGLTLEYWLGNTDLDAKLYGWSKETVNAILQGLKWAQKEAPQC